MFLVWKTLDEIELQGAQLRLGVNAEANAYRCGFCDEARAFSRIGVSAGAGDAAGLPELGLDCLEVGWLVGEGGDFFVDGVYLCLGEALGLGWV
jgi:hypothetical protein